ncbi:MAG: 2-oxoglutarate carboxylase large subunit [Actinobacteria bacterium]|nr:2-oxoglutarate carboxylase large subunit [Actinomycetota bacterium]
MKNRPIKITDTTLRDGNQSLWLARLRTEDILPILPKMDQIGFSSIEVWGGAIFDACLTFLKEDPWQRLRAIKERVPKTPLQMLLRGQNLVGYRHYSDDVVHKFVKLAAKNGIDIFRIFDPLNDVRNFRTAIEAAKEAGAHVQGAVVYTISPVHTLEHYLEIAHQLVDMGIDSLCIKDRTALLSPSRTHSLIQELKKNFSLPLQLHCHYAGGLALINYLKAIEAGVDAIDTVSIPLASGNSQPPTEMIATALKDTPYDTHLDLERLYEIAEYFEEIRIKRGFERGSASVIQMKQLSQQIPGRMISNLQAQLKEKDALSRLEEVLEEIPKVRAEAGFPPLITPLSQIIGTQAILNVLTGKRWSVVPDEMKSYVKGLYGRPPGPVAEDIQKKVLEDEKPIDCRPADLLPDFYDVASQEIGDLAVSSEDVLSYCLFPQATRSFLESKRGIRESTFSSPESAEEDKEPQMDLGRIREVIKLMENSNLAEMIVEEGDLRITLRKSPGSPGTREGSQVREAERGEKKVPLGEEELQKVISPMVGTFYRTSAPEQPPFVEVGDIIEVGQPLCMVEAMKLMNEIISDIEGEVVEICVEDGQPVEYGQVLFWIRPL